MPSARLKTAAAVAAVAAGLTLTGCGSSSDDAASSGAKKIAVKVTDAGCAAEPATAEAGALTFEVTNSDAKRVTEAEILKDGKILGEKENLTQACPAPSRCGWSRASTSCCARTPRPTSPPFTVTAAKGATAAATTDANLASSVTTYKAYLEDQTAQLTAQTEKFVAAVKAGDVAKAKALFAPTRAYYERIEPVAESFGDLDPQIDARVNDVDPGDEWTGFHKIEKALWAGRQARRDGPGRGQAADRRQGPAGQGQGGGAGSRSRSPTAPSACWTRSPRARSPARRTATATPTCGTSPPTSPAPARPSTLLSPALRAKDAALLAKINGQFADVLASLSQYQTADGYQDYSAVTDDQRRTMTTRSTRWPSRSARSRRSSPERRAHRPSTHLTPKGHAVSSTGNLSRRRFLGGLGAAGAGAGLGAVAVTAHAETPGAAQTPRPAPARAGWTSTAATRPASAPPSQDRLAFAAFDVTTKRRRRAAPGAARLDRGRRRDDPRRPGARRPTTTWRRRRQTPARRAGCRRRH